MTIKADKDFVKKNKKQLKNYEDDLLERLSDVDFAKECLIVALEEFDKDGDYRAFLLTLKDIAIAQGGFSKLSKTTKLNRQNLYRTLSKKGNPTIDTFDKVLRELGFRISIEPTKSKPRNKSFSMKEVDIPVSTYTNSQAGAATDEPVQITLAVTGGIYNPDDKTVNFFQRSLNAKNFERKSI